MAVNYQKCIKREAKLKCNLVYLLRCRKNKIHPPFLVKKADRFFKEQVSRSRAHKAKILQSKMLLQNRYLSTEIDIVAKQIRECRQRISQLNFDLCDALPPDAYRTFMQTQQKLGTSIYNDNKTRLQAKFDRISGKRPQTMNEIFTTSGVTNFTDLVIPEPILHLLSLGPKFALRPRNINIKNGLNILAGPSKMIASKRFNSCSVKRKD